MLSGRVAEVVEYLIAAGLLSVVDEGHTVDGKRQHRERIAVLSVLLCERLAAIVEVLVVIGEIDHSFERLGSRFVNQGVRKSLQPGCCITRRTEVGQVALELPGIVVVETYILEACCILYDVCFTEEGDVLAFLVRLDEGDGRLPVGGRDARTADVVATVSVDVGLVNPEFQAVVHGVHQSGIVVVELPHVAVVVRVDHLSAALGIVFGMRGHPVGICCRVVGHPVEPDFHLQFVGTLDEGLEVADAAVFRIHLLEVGGCIRAARGATRIDGHQPDDVYAGLLQFDQAFLCSIQCACCCERPYVHLVDDAPALGILCRSIVDVVHIVGSLHPARRKHEHQ